MECNNKNCKNCEYPCMRAGHEDRKPISQEELYKMGYILCDYYTEDFEEMGADNAK